MEGATSSLAVSCEESSMIGSVTAASEQMSAQGCLSSSLRAALNFGSVTAASEQMSAQGRLPSSLRAALNFGSVTAASEQMSAQGCLPSSLRASLNFGSVTAASEQMSAQGCLPSSLRASLNFGSVTAASEQLSTHLPSSLRAALNFVSSHPTLGSQELFPPLSPRRFPNGINFGCTGAKENPIVIEDEQDEEKSLNYVEKQNNYVYKRRKLQGNSVTLLPKQIQTATGKDCLPNGMLNSDWLSQPAQVENFPECHEDINYCDANVFTSHIGYSGNFSSSEKKQINCKSNGILDGEKCKTYARVHVDCKAPDSEEILLYHTGSSGLIVDGEKMNLNIVEVGEASSGSRSVIEDSTSLQVQSSSSFEMSNCNLGRTTVPVKNELTELAECTSSVDVTRQSQENDLEKEWCVSVLKQCGLLGWFVSSREYAAVGHPGVVGDGSCPQLCKICGSLEDSMTTLICDLCDEAFHMSCCNPKVKAVPTQDDWYCQFCRKKRKRPGKKSLIESKSAQNAAKDTCTNLDKSKDKGDIFSCMLENSEPYTTQVRIGKAFQADVPNWIGNVPNDAEMLYLGEPLEKEFPEQNLINELWSKGWQPARSFFPGSMENWLQCQNVICVVGTCSDDEKAKDIICGKWRRAPLSQVQNDEWDCSCAVVWDPVHADCAVPQAKPQLVYKKRKNKMKHCIAEEGQNRMEGPSPL
ncbi:uncharacterized protein LOC131060721 isoform X3 [Cryptomeria japonica]|uniref:uncharacterized protein LOC131060721 isoform X3 n=1 Tax=Cryptomeria japonica TaxID=3369 RepID=UPI0025AB8A34|nr:uncharacterized protein LOC131060721 isoform X3 [Cryptomeria japonica]